MTTLPKRRPFSIDVSAAIATCSNTCASVAACERAKARPAPSATLTATMPPGASRGDDEPVELGARHVRGRARTREDVDDRDVDGAVEPGRQLREHLAGVAVPHAHLRAAGERQVLAHEVDELGLELDDLLPRARPGRRDVAGERERAAAEVHRRDRPRPRAARGRSRGRCGARTRSRASRGARARRATAACRRRRGSTTPATCRDSSSRARWPLTARRRSRSDTDATLPPARAPRSPRTTRDQQAPQSAKSSRCAGEHRGRERPVADAAARRVRRGSPSRRRDEHGVALLGAGRARTGRRRRAARRRGRPGRRRAPARARRVSPAASATLTTTRPPGRASREASAHEGRVVDERRRLEPRVEVDDDDVERRGRRRGLAATASPRRRRTSSMSAPAGSGSRSSTSVERARRRARRRPATNRGASRRRSAASVRAPPPRCSTRMRRARRAARRRDVADASHVLEEQVRRVVAGRRATAPSRRRAA